jgi:hypothetical protein
MPSDNDASTSVKFRNVESAQLHPTGRSNKLGGLSRRDACCRTRRRLAEVLSGGART